MPLTCESCGRDVRRVLLHGGALWCAPCVSDATPVERANGVCDDTIIGGQWVENLGRDPVFVQSRSELRAIAKARGLTNMVRHVEGSPHTTSWATIDPYTLRNAEILAKRASEQGYMADWRSVRMKNPFTGDRMVVDYDAKNPGTSGDMRPLDPSEIPRR